MELLVVMAVIAILATFAIPTMWGYIRSATVRAGAQEMRTALQQAKQLAIRNRQNICVQPVLNGYQYRQNTCAGAVLIVPVMRRLALGADHVGRLLRLHVLLSSCATTIQ